MLSISDTNPGVYVKLGLIIAVALVNVFFFLGGGGGDFSNYHLCQRRYHYAKRGRIQDSLVLSMQENGLYSG